jgi:hypothetical protein
LARAVAAAINLAVHRSMVSMDDLVIRLSPALRRTLPWGMPSRAGSGVRGNCV